MSENVNHGYGYTSDEPSFGGGVFGLNPGAARLIKFEWINDAGKDGMEGEALDIQFSLEGFEKPMSLRLFKIAKAFDKNGAEVTDESSPEFQKEVRNLNAVVVHILHAFNDAETVKNALNVPINGFKDFCKIAMSLIPKDADKIPLDIFLHYQWAISPNAKKTYLNVPRKMTLGKFVCQAIPPVGEWKAVIHPNPEEKTPVALKYVDDENNVHPFMRNGWFMLSNYAKQQVSEEEGEIVSEGSLSDQPEAERSAWGNSSPAPAAETPAAEVPEA